MAIQQNLSVTIWNILNIVTFGNIVATFTLGILFQTTRFYYQALFTALLTYLLCIKEMFKPFQWRSVPFWINVLNHENSQYAVNCFLLLSQQPQYLFQLIIGIYTFYHLINLWHSSKFWCPKQFVEFVFKRHQQALYMTAMLEFFMIFSLLFNLITGKGGLLFIFQYWNFLNRRYDNSPYFKIVSGHIGHQFDKFFGNSLVPSFVWNIYSRLKRILCRSAYLQPQRSDRTYYDHESVFEAMNGVCHLFEQKLKSMHPSATNITYDVNDLFNYIDSLRDISCLVFEQSVQCYRPFGKDWIKKRVFKHLKQQAT